MRKNEKDKNDMPQLKLTDLASYREYFRAIAESHVDIQGFRWGDKDVIRNDNRSSLPPAILWATPYDSAAYEASHDDNTLKRKRARVAYLVVPSSEAFQDIDNAIETAEAVIEQIMARIKQDKAGSTDEGEWYMIATRIASWRGGPVEMKIGSTRYVGWEMEIDFLDNANLEYDPSKWT